MEAPSSRFTAAEGGTRLAAAARARNSIVAEHTAFVATRLLHEEAHKIRGPRADGFQRSLYVTRPSQVRCSAYNLTILTDLAVRGEADQLTPQHLDDYQVLVCTSLVARRALEDGVLTMADVNVLIIDSCHLICKDDNLKYLMSVYKAAEETKRPRILALTYPLFTSTKKEEPHDFTIDITNSGTITDKGDSRIDVEEDELSNPADKRDKEGISDSIGGKSHDSPDKPDILSQNQEETEPTNPDENPPSSRKSRSKMGAYENYDDFKMYEKFEWKLDELEKELCCSADLAEDIDGVKRISVTIAKPKELIVEFASQSDTTALSEQYQEVEKYMRDAVNGALDFLEEHRYDPTEIYGEDMYEEFKNIPDPTIEPKRIFTQFLYVLDQLGPYGADKAALSLLLKLEKLKIKVPYERHFLLLCLCASVFVKIRCFADSVFSTLGDEWGQIRACSTPKLLRFIEILTKFQPKSSPPVSDTSNKIVTDINPTTTEKPKSLDTEKLTGDIEKLDLQTPKSNSPVSDTSNKIVTDDSNQTTTEKLLSDIDKLDFQTLCNKIENTVNTYEANLKDLHDTEAQTNKNLRNEVDKDKSVNETHTEVNDTFNQQSSSIVKDLLGFSRRLNRQRGRGRVPRSHANRLAQMQQNPDSLCGIVFMKEPLLAKILLMVISELCRHHPPLSFLCAQYSAIEKPADPVAEPREFEQQRKKQEEVLKNFRMHECNLLLATSALEEGIDLPRCNLVLRWDVPASFRSYGLCRGRARAPRSACVLLSRHDGGSTDRVLHHLATYKELDKIVSRKCGCGIQDEPPQSEEDHADTFTSLVAPYATTHKKPLEEASSPVNAGHTHLETSNLRPFDQTDEQYSIVEELETTDGGEVKSYQVVTGNTGDETNGVKGDKNGDAASASVDLSTAIALINRYCLKLPSDTFTRLAPQWWTEEVTLPVRGKPGETRPAFVCTVRLPLNCPVKYNIVGHPMPTRTLARRMVALQACRILHKSGELDNQLMPIGKDNFKSAELEATGSTHPADSKCDPTDLARPGTTKRRQYYFKRTARAFSDCQPVVDSTDADIGPPCAEEPKVWGRDNFDDECKAVGSQNVLYAIVYTLQCALPERYNTRGRRLHAPQSASQALALLTKQTKHPFQIPAFPVYTRSGEVRVSLERVGDADVRVSPRRARLVRTFMRFVFAEVLRVRRRGMRLHTEPGQTNNYYIVPTIKTVRENGTTKIDIDWAFLETIYKHTEENKLCDLEKPFSLNPDEEESEVDKRPDDVARRNYENRQATNVGEEIAKSEDVATRKPDDINLTNFQPEVNCDTTTISDKIASDTPKGIHDTFHSRNDALRKENRVNDVKNGAEKGKGKRMSNPLLRPGETFHFDAEKYKEAVVTPWYRNQDQPQYFLVAEICWNLSPDSVFPSSTHATFRSYYETKYRVTLTQSDQPLLDVDHTSARLNLLTPRYVNRKGVALPVSSERTRRAKRDRLDQKQILVPELCRVHPFAAPLWFATVALPCVLYRINALLIADEIRQAVAIDVGLGIPTINDDTCPGFQWPPLDFGWSLAEVLNADPEKGDKKRPEDEPTSDKESNQDSRMAETNGLPNGDVSEDENGEDQPAVEKTINDILQEKEDAHGFEIGIWSNDMAASVPAAMEYDELLDPLPSNLTFCTSASGGTNWCDPIKKPPPSSFNSGRAFSVADSDCSYMSSDFDTDDSDLNSVASDEDTDNSSFSCSKTCNAAMGVRIEYKTAREAEAVDVERKERAVPAPQPDEQDERRDRSEQDRYMRSGEAPKEYIEKFHAAIASHKEEIHQKGLLILRDQPIGNLLPETHKPPSPTKQVGDRKQENIKLLEQIFPYGNGDVGEMFADGEVTLENIEKHKRELLELLRKSTPAEEVKKLNCFSMKDVDIDSPNYVNEKIANIGFDTKESYMERVKVNTEKRDFVPYYEDTTVSNSMKDFDFDYQPNLEGHPGPSPSLILQAMTMSNANDGINLERLETIGDSFLKFAITAYLYCAHPTVHEGKLSHMRSKHVSNLNLYRLGRNKRLGARMIASKFEPHDNWLPPCHKPPATLDVRPNIDHRDRPEHSSGEGCFIPYNLITQHSIPDKSIADCVEALIGAYLLSCGGRGALLFMSWLGLRVLPRHEVPHAAPDYTKLDRQAAPTPPTPPSPRHRDVTDSDFYSSDDEEEPSQELPADDEEHAVEWSWSRRVIGSLKPYKDEHGHWRQSIFGELKAPPSPLLRYVEDPEGELEQMLSGYDALERTLQYRFRDRSLLLQALTHASHQTNRLTDCYQRLEFLGDAILDYLITRHLYEDSRRHSPGALTDLRSALVNNTIFATLAVRHGFHKYFRHMSPGLNEVLTKYVKIQEENGHSISEEHYLIQEDEMEQAEDVEVPKALGDLFESVAGAIFLDSGMSLGAVWRSYVSLMGAELEAFSAAAPKSPVRELLEAEPDTAKFGKPERLADGRRVRVCVEVFGRGAFKGIGRNYRIAKGTAARCALRHLKIHRAH